MLSDCFSATQPTMELHKTAEHTENCAPLARATIRGSIVPGNDVADARRDTLKRAMDAAGLDPKGWATKAGISPNTLYNFLNKRSASLNQETLEKLAGAVSLTAGELLDGVAPEQSMGARIKAVRKSLYLNQQQFAKLIGTTQASVSRWESEAGEPDEAAIKRLGEIDGRGPAYIRYGHAEPPPGVPANDALRMAALAAVRCWQTPDPALKNQGEILDSVGQAFIEALEKHGYKVSKND